MKTMQTIKTITISASLLFLAACGGNKQSSDARVKTLDSLKKEMATLQGKIGKLEVEIAKDDTSKKEKVMTVELQTLSAQTFNNYIDVQGKVDADENVSLSSEMPGTVVKL